MKLFGPRPRPIFQAKLQPTAISKDHGPGGSSAGSLQSGKNLHRNKIRCSVIYGSDWIRHGACCQLGTKKVLIFYLELGLVETVSAGPSFAALKYPSKIQVVHIEFKLVLKEYTVGIMCIIYGLLSSPVRISGFTHATQGLHPWNGN